MQVVDYGPNDTELRFFKSRDAEQARALARVLRDALPALELKDFSSQYGKVGWLKPGHYELWLAPQVNRFETPR